MAVTVSAKDYTLIDACDLASNWTGEGPVDQTGFYKENSACVGFVCRGAGDNDMYVTGTWDLSGMQHLHAWMMTVVIAELNYVQVYVSDGSNTGYYNALLKADYPGGWYNIVVDLSRAVDSGTKPVMSAITTVGFRFNHTGIGKNAENTWLDHVYAGNGLIAYGDVSGSPFGLQEIFDADDAQTGGWGIIRKIGGVYYMVGSLTLGDDGGSNICDFQETNEVLIFEERLYNTIINVASGLYEILCVAGTGTTDIFWGDVSGGKGISGCTIKAIDADRPFKFTATDTDIDSFGLYATTFDVHGVIDLFPYNANYAVLGCSFVNSPAQIQPNTITFEDNFIISGTSIDGSVLFESTSHNMEYNNYINCSRATEFPTADTYSVIGDQFTGNTYDVHFSASTGDLIINAGGTPPANPSPAKVENDSSGTVTINNTVTITITVKNSAGTAIENARVYMEADTGGDLPSHESVTSITRSASTATVTHTTHGLSTGQRVNIEGANQHEYNGIHTITVTDANTYTYTVAGTPDTPATGTITCTFIMVEELTTALGVATEEFDYSSSQPFKAWARKSSASPYYRTTEFTGSISSSGFIATVTLASDE